MRGNNFVDQPMKRLVWFFLSVSLALVATLSAESPSERPARPQSSAQGNFREKEGSYQAAKYVVRVTAYYREEDGSIGGPSGPRSKKIHTYGGKIYIRALPGHSLKKGSQIVFNGRVHNLKEATTAARRSRNSVFAEAEAVETSGIDLTTNDFRQDFSVRLLLQTDSGTALSIREELTIASTREQPHALTVTKKTY